MPLIRRRRFEVINTSLSIGEYKLVPKKDEKGQLVRNESDQIMFTVDTQTMLEKTTALFNALSLNLTYPTDRTFSFDESQRPSRVRFDPLRRYNPNKPAKFGNLIYLLVDSDSFIHRIVWAQRRQFQEKYQTFFYCLLKKGIILILITVFSSIFDLMTNHAIPEVLYNRGCRLYCDNLFISDPLCQYYSERDTCLLGTVRSNRITRFFTKDYWARVNGKAPYSKEVFGKNQFRRKLLVFDKNDGSFKHNSLFVYFDKRSARKPVLIMTNSKYHHQG